MAKKTDIFKLISKKPFNLISILLIMGLVVILATALTGRSKILADRISRVEISGQGRSITINENGLVEIRTEDGVIYQTLGSNQLSALFNYIQKKAESPQRLTASSPGNIIAIVIVIDEREVTIYIDADDPEFQDILDTILGDATGGELISDYFGEEVPKGDERDFLDEGFFDTEVSPTPTQAVGQSPTGTSSSPNLYLPPGVIDPGGDCASWNDQIIGKAVISNTVCFKQ